MHPTRDLERLAAYKARLQVRIARRRQQCVEDVAHVAKPLAWLDRLIAVCRQISPLTALAALPLGAVLRRTGFARVAKATAVLRWMPLAVKLVRGFTASQRNSPRLNKGSDEIAFQSVLPRTR